MSKPPSWNEIRSNAQAFATRWVGTTDENAEAQTFWNEFLGVFGVDRRRVASFEARAKRTSTGGRGLIDLFWPGTLVAEHKSAGKDLDHAEEQALDYLESIDQENFPGVIITSDFARLRIRDLGGDNVPYTVTLERLPSEIDRFAFIAGYRQRTFGDHEEESANITAARLMAGLYEELSRGGYEGHDASVLMTRLLFLMFGDDTAMWEKALFSEFLETRTQDDGSDLGPQLAFLFQTLDRPEDKRPAQTDELLMRFPYVNGRLFSDRIDIPVFDKQMRDELIKCANFNWSLISPAVFGSLFQAVKSKDARRTLGEHYTTEQNILRLLDPLFLEDLREEFNGARHSVQRLERLHDRLANIKVFDPACGCGNFLIIAYRELRRIELSVLKALAELRGDRQMVLDTSVMQRVRLSSFTGIEFEEWPARIAETGMFLVDQQANHELARTFGQAPDRLPIMNAANLAVGNALRLDWNKVLPADQCTFIVGNPPFVGMALMSKDQQEDNRLVFSGGLGGSRSGRFDYVACWYAKAIEYMKGTKIRAALVSTNSITQGEQARELGPMLAANGFQIDFAHRTFAWTSEAPGAAQVHVVIVGFSYGGLATKKRLFDYPDIRGAARELAAKSINIYLVGAQVPGIGKHTTPLVSNPKLTEGNRPQDGGGLIVTADEYDQVAADPVASKYLRRLVGAHDMLQGGQRWCLWLVDAPPGDIRASKVITERLERVAEARRSSPTAAAREKANTPGLFLAIRQPKGRWLCVPRHSSEYRRIIPMAFFGPDDIAHDSTLSLDGADVFLFGILQSAMFTVWAKTVSGRLKSDIRVSPDLSYNAFPFPDVASAIGEQRVVAAAEQVLSTRASFPESSLADLYDPIATPAALVKAHNDLDVAVDALYTGRRLSTGAERLEVLFARYAELTSDLFAAEPRNRRQTKS